MSLLLDTSVLIASFINSHPQHRSCLKIFHQVSQKKEEGFVASYSLAECYTVLTSYPIKPSISYNLAERLIEENIRSYFKIIDLSVKDYFDAIKRLKNLQLKGGVIYDALIYQAAIKKKIDKIYTLNLKDFNRVESGHIEILSP